MRKTLGLAIMMLTVSPYAIAQQSGGGTFTEFSLTSSLKASDNWDMVDDPDGDSFQFSNDLYYKLSSETRRAKAEIAHEVGNDVRCVIAKKQ